MMARRVAIVGSGQTYHSGGRTDVNAQEMITEAVVRALESAELTIDDIDGIVIGNMDHFEGINYVDTWSVPATGGTLKPVIKLTTGGTTGTTLAIGGYHLVASGFFSKLLVIGWEKNSESDTTAAITTAFDPIWDRLVFAGAIGGLAVEAQAYLARYNHKKEDAARVVVRDRKHGANNPYAHMQKEVTIKQVLSSPPLADPLHFLDMCPRTDGACAVIFADEYSAEKICDRPAWILGTSVRHNAAFSTDVNFDGLKTMESAARELFHKTGITDPLEQLDVIEMYLPYSYAGLIWIESLGLCKKGDGPRLVWDGVTDMGGKLPINPSGGPICANPIGATGLIRVAEAALQIQNRAEKRQVPDAKIALATGFGGCFWTDLVLLGAKKP
ncbi:MAG: thiolase family protein [Leptospiraceae bacterium]|nr:thiolase family protein [Leptospiraceae bacterium]